MQLLQAGWVQMTHAVPAHQLVRCTPDVRAASGLQEQVLSACLVLRNSCSVALRLVQEKAQLGAAMAEGEVTGILPPVRASATARTIRGAH